MKNFDYGRFAIGYGYEGGIKCINHHLTLPQK